MLSPVPGQSQSSEQLLMVAGSALFIPVQGGLAFSSPGENLVSKSLTGVWTVERASPFLRLIFFRFPLPFLRSLQKFCRSWRNKEDIISFFSRSFLLSSSHKK